jgi:hypothetical protein
MSDFSTPEIRRRHGIRLLHHIEQVDGPLRALLNHIAATRLPENEKHFEGPGESFAVGSTIRAFIQEMEFLNGLAQHLIDEPRPSVELWEASESAPERDDHEENWELPF